MSPYGDVSVRSGRVPDMHIDMRASKIKVQGSQEPTTKVADY